MIYITLPNFYKNYKAINFICAIDKDVMFKLPVTFCAATGNFPYCPWNGGYNNCQGEGAYYKNFIEFTEYCPVPIRINCSNENISLLDFENSMGNLILRSNDNGVNTIEISDLKFVEFISSRYKNYRFVLSKESGLTYDLSPDLINQLIDTGLFYKISLPEKLSTDFEFISKIKDKSVLEAQLTSACNIKCRRYEECKKHEHCAQYDYSKENNFIGCNKRDKHIYEIISFDDIEKYTKLGINNFCLGEMDHGVNGDLVSFVVDYFVKDEFKVKVLEKAREENI